MDDVTLTDKEFLGLKISNWESIPYSVSLKCPNECSTTFHYKSTDVESKIIGWCETPNGYICLFMSVQFVLKNLDVITLLLPAIFWTNLKKILN